MQSSPLLQRRSGSLPLPAPAFSIRRRSGRGRFPHELRDDGSESEKRHARDDAERDDTVDAPDAEDIFFDMRQVQGKGKSGERGNQQKAIRARESEGDHEDVSDDPEDGDGNG